jgi:L-ascorbate metabolism protein UlaG (beta-lactamase superfamily)
MTVDEAVQAARVIRPEIVVPMHYDKGIGTPQDGQNFARLYGGKVSVLKHE